MTENIDKYGELSENDKKMMEIASSDEPEIIDVVEHSEIEVKNPIIRGREWLKIKTEEVSYRMDARTAQAAINIYQHLKRISGRSVTPASIGITAVAVCVEVIKLIKSLDYD